MSKLLFENNEWTFDKLELVLAEVEKIAKEELNLDYYPLQIEIINADQMLDAYSSHALPIYYHHWSQGKRHIKDETSYKKGQSGLAFEIIANTSPSIAYLMETNSMTMQTLVLAHCLGHSAYFKTNYNYRQWTNAESIVDYLKFAKNYIQKCEDQFGAELVEQTLDAAHALQYNSLDRYKRKKKTKKQLKAQSNDRAKFEEQNYNDIWKIIGAQSTTKLNKTEKEKLKAEAKRRMLSEPEENILYFLEKNSPTLQTWQREILRIVRKIGEYFYPQMQDKVSNEGFACFIHYYIMNRLFDKGLISEGSMLEFLSSHSSVIMQTTPDFRSEEQKQKDRMRGKSDPYSYSGINVYALGFAMMQDIKRMCENPTEEDAKWFPDIVGKDWKEVIIRDVIPNYRDESFIQQFLSPKVMRDFRLFTIRNDENDTREYGVLATHTDSGYKEVRKTLAEQYDINRKLTNIQIVDCDILDTRTLKLHHYATNNQILAGDPLEMLQYIKRLWGYDVILDSLDVEGEIMECYSTKTIK